MDQRAKGLETEYRIVVDDRDSGTIVTGREALALLGWEWPISGRWREDGGREYLDGRVPETATPECRKPRDVVAHDKVGEADLGRAAAELEQRLRDQGRNVTAHVYKNNETWRGQGQGSHENYQVEPAFYVALMSGHSEMLAALSTFLGTRGLVCGGGHVAYLPPGVPAFGFSQRAAFMSRQVGGTRRGDRGLITQRDEPHADRRAHARLHIICGDSNLSETSLLLRMVATELVVGFFENGGRAPHLAAKDPVDAMRRIDFDLTGRTRVAMADGSTRSALALQDSFLQLAAGYAERSGLLSDPWVEHALWAWAHVLDAIREGRLEDIRGDVDWAAKFFQLGEAREAYAAEHGRPMPYEVLRRAGFDYSDVVPGRGGYQGLVREGQMSRVLTDAEIALAAGAAPDDTRALLRAQLQAFDNPATRTSVVPNWSSVFVQLPNRAGRTIGLPDPLQTTNAEVTAVLEQLRQMAAPRSSGLPATVPGRNPRR